MLSMLLLLTAWFAPPQAFAASPFHAANSVYVGFGLFDHDVGRLANAPSGSTSFTSSLYTTLSLTGEFALGGSWYFSPILSYSPLGSKSADSNEKTYVLPFALRLEERLDPLEFHAGPGLLLYKISGTGGTVTLANGTGSAVFGLPADSQSTTLLLLNLGLGYHYNAFLFSADTYVTGLASSRRAVNLAVSISYGVF